MTGTNPDRAADRGRNAERGTKPGGPRSMARPPLAQDDGRPPAGPRRRAGSRPLAWGVLALQRGPCSLAGWLAPGALAASDDLTTTEGRPARRSNSPLCRSTTAAKENRRRRHARG